jgi:hypothetical protein
MQEQRPLKTFFENFLGPADFFFVIFIFGF